MSTGDTVRVVGTESNDDWVLESGHITNGIGTIELQTMSISCWTSPRRDSITVDDGFTGRVEHDRIEGEGTLAEQVTIRHFGE
ncbi:MAG: hypothetical protein U1D30_06975 [Planctomycetota bacterium]